MSELMNETRASQPTRRNLLVTVCAAALITALCAEGEVWAHEKDEPTIWIEVGGQLERTSESQDRFSAPFLFKTPTPEPFSPSPFEEQRRPRFSYGIEGKISYQPEGSDWDFSAAVRYGRSNGDKHTHKQTSLGKIPKYLPEGFGSGTASGFPTYVSKFADTKAKHRESHAILDFQVGKDVGVGMFGRNSESIFKAGVRYAQFSSRSDVDINARPNVTFYKKYKYPFIVPPYYLQAHRFHNYTLSGQSERNFHGIGPSVSWNASVPFAGNGDSAEFTFDWGMNGALLFGRQKANTKHQEMASYYRMVLYNRPTSEGFSNTHYNMLYQHRLPSKHRSRSVVVPNLGGFVGASLRFPNAKVSLGYRGDFFFGAMDGGIDTRKSEDVSFHGPFATLSIGLGG